MGYMDMPSPKRVGFVRHIGHKIGYGFSTLVWKYWVCFLEEANTFHNNYKKDCHPKPNINYVQCNCTGCKGHKIYDLCNLYLSQVSKFWPGHKQLGWQKLQTLVINGVRVYESCLHTPTWSFWEYSLGIMSHSNNCQYFSMQFCQPLHMHKLKDDVIGDDQNDG